MLDPSLLLSFLLSFGSFSVVDVYLRALTGERDTLAAVQAGVAAALTGLGVQIAAGISAVVVAFCLSVPAAAVLVRLKRGTLGWRVVHR